MTRWTIALTALGCVEPTLSADDPTPALLPDPSFPVDWEPDDPAPPSPEPLSSPRLTLLTDAGPLTIDLRDPSGRPIEVTAAVAFDEDGDGAEELYLSAEERRYRFDPDTHTLVEAVPWVDGQGVPWVPDTLASGFVANAPVLVGSRGSELRLWDVEAQAFVVAAPMTVAPDLEAATLAFTPRALAVLHLSSPTIGNFVGLDPDGGVHLDTTPLAFVPFLVPPTLCDRTPLRPDAVVVARLAEPFGIIDETMWLVVDGAIHEVSGALTCFEESATALDDRDAPVAVRFGVGVDFDGDAIDTVVWGHR